MAKTVEELKLGFDRIEAAQACRNLMGKASYLQTAFRFREYVDLWADRADDLLVMPWGWYQGKEGVRACFLEDHGDREDPETRASLLYQTGMMMHCLDTEVLEVAGDCETAMGAWISPGHESSFVPDPSSGCDASATDAPTVPSCKWAWGKYRVDFIREGGVWKFWKMRMWPVYKTDFYHSWTEGVDEDPAGRFTHQKPLPEPSWTWSPDAVYPPDEPEPPLPYEHYEDAVPAVWAVYQ